MKRVTSRTRPGTWWARHARSALTDRIGLKLTALALAIVLWFSVTVRESAEETVTVRFLPTLEAGLALEQQPARIQALVRGSGRDILKLYTTPPAIRISIGGSVGDSITLSLRPSDVDLPPGVSATVHDVQPHRITLTLARARNRRAGGGVWARPAAPDEAASSLTP